MKLRGEPVSRILSKGFPPLDDHSSANRVATAVKLPTRASRALASLRAVSTACAATGPRARPLFGIAPGGACRAVLVAKSAVGSYPTVSPSPRQAEGEPSLTTGQSLLCGAFPGVTPAGRYPAPLPTGVRTFLGSCDPRPSSPPREASVRRRRAVRQPQSAAGPPQAPGRCRPAAPWPRV